jgi:lipopolysaccharide export system protein LptA
LIPVRVFHLRARDLLAPCWLAAALTLPGACLAQRQLPQAPKPEPVQLEVSEPATGPFGIQRVTAANPTPGVGAGTASQPTRAQPATALTPRPAATGLVTIESDLQRADQATGVITSIGNVRIVYPDQRVVATARQAQYFSKEGRVVLSGDVDIVQEGGNLIRAEQVIYLVNSERLLATPPAGQQVLTRVRIVSKSAAASQPGATTAAASAVPNGIGLSR